jgi:DNA mismatch repair protein MutL
MPIQILPDTLVARIAAGEVVERPASVVKELVENAIDAGSRDIKIECAEGGRRLIRISDDGSGIRADEVTLAFMHHATSKLRSVDDLSHIMTLGFRGEALASVASVSSVTCTTRHLDEPTGTLIRVDNGQIINQERIGRTPGTTMTIEHLFARVPARLKFLKSNQTERGHIDAMVTRYALAYPGVRFTLTHDNRRAFQSLGNGNLRDVLIEVFGASAVEQMIPVGDFGFSNADFGLPNSDSDAQPQVEPPLPVEGDESQALAENPKSKIDNPKSSIVVHGYAALPTMDHANRTKIILFVNGRPVQDAKLSYAVIQAYHTLLMTGRFPIAVIMVQVPSEDVDVNVHPAKAEVRFRDAEAVFSAIQRAVRRALLDHLPVPEPPSVFVDRRLEIGDLGLGIGDSQTSPSSPQSPISNYQSPSAHLQSPLSGSETWDRVGIARNAPPQSPTSSLESPDNRQSSIVNRQSQIPALRILGQLAASYVIAEGPEGLYLIDQHAAHERIMYERMMAAREMGATASQALLDPTPVDVPAESAHLLEGDLPALHELGFEIDHFGGNTFLVRAVPAEMIQDDIAAALREIVADLEMGDAPLAKDIEARVVRRVCKRMAIKAGRVLTYAEMAALVRDLEACHSPRTCPHGRPTMIQIGVAQLEREFGRLG